MQTMVKNVSNYVRPQVSPFGYNWHGDWEKFGTNGYRHDEMQTPKVGTLLMVRKSNFFRYKIERKSV